MTHKKIENFFVNNKYTWNFSDGRRTPTEDEIDRTVLAAIDALRDEPDRAQLEVGRLIVQKNGQFYDIYVHIAEVPQ